MISIDESYELFLLTLSRLDYKNLLLNDEDLQFEIFEEFDSEYHSFFHEWTVNRLIEGGLISHEVGKKVLYLRGLLKSTIDIKNTTEMYRNDQSWELIRKEANEILSIL